MCSVLYVGEREVGTRGEMRLAGIEPVTHEAYALGYTPRYGDCLCTVDIRESCRRAGLEVDEDHGADVWYVRDPAVRRLVE